MWCGQLVINPPQMEATWRGWRGWGGDFTMVENVNVPLSRLTWAAVKSFNRELIWTNVSFWSDLSKTLCGFGKKQSVNCNFTWFLCLDSHHGAFFCNHSNYNLPSRFYSTFSGILNQSGMAQRQRNCCVFTNSSWMEVSWEISLI